MVVFLEMVIFLLVLWVIVMNKSVRGLVIILIILILLLVGTTYTYNHFKSRISSNNSDMEISEALKLMMIDYGKGISGDERYNKEGEYFVYLDDIMRDRDFDKGILSLMVCDTSNSYLIIRNKSGKFSYDVNLDCLINRDRDGIYYGYDSLVRVLKGYSDIVMDGYDYREKESGTRYIISLKQMDSDYKMDMSMFRDNYDFDKSYVIVTSNKSGDGYVFDYEVILSEKESSS